MLGYTLRLVMKRSSKCSNLSFRLLNVGIVVDNAFGNLGSPMFSWVTFWSDSSSLSTMWCGYFWLGGCRLDDRGGISVWGNTPVTMCWPSNGGNSFITVDLDVEAWFSISTWSTSEFSVLGVWPDNGLIFEDRFSIILRIPLWPISVSFILLMTDFSIFSDISQKSRSEKLSTFSVLWLAVSGSFSELDTESLLAFLLDDLSDILVWDFPESSRLFDENEDSWEFWYLLIIEERRKQNCFTSRITIFQLNLFQNFQVHILSAHVKREKSAILSHLVQPGVVPRRRKREFNSALSNSDSHFVHAFRGKQASTSCLSCDSASLRLQFPPLRNAEAEKNVKSESLHAPKGRTNETKQQWNWEISHIYPINLITA